MAQNSGVYVEGLRETIRTLESLGVDIADMKEAFYRIGDFVAGQARSLAPKRKGTLVNSIKASKTKNKATVRAGSAAKVPYAGPINYGWPKRHITANGFLTEAANNNTERILQMLDDELTQLVQKAQNQI